MGITLERWVEELELGPEWGESAGVCDWRFDADQDKAFHPSAPV